jgi:MFS family permease
MGNGGQPLNLIHAFFPKVHDGTTMPEGAERRNLRYLRTEIAFAAVMGGIFTFHATFAVRLGATKEMIAWLSSGPALIAALFSIPTAVFMQKRVHREWWMFSALYLTRLVGGLLGFVPVFFPVNPALWLIVWVVLLNVPSILFMNGFQALLSEVIPPDKRARVISQRSVVWSLVITATSALAGIWLDRVAFPTNFELMYLFGLFVSIGSHWCLNKMLLPMSQTQTLRLMKASKMKLERAKMTPAMRRILVNSAIYTFGVQIPQSLFTIYYIERLNADNTWIGINAAAGSFGVVLGFMFWERLLRRHTFNWALRRASLLTWVFPVGVALFPNLGLIVWLNMLVNFLHPGVELSIMNLMMKQGSVENRAVYMSWYNSAIQATIFVGPLLGAFLATPLGIPAVFVLSGAMRVVGGMLFNLNPIPEDGGETSSPAAR